MRWLALLPVLGLTQCVAGSTSATLSAMSLQAITIRADPIAIEPITRFGKLRLLAGWHLTSITRAFGGLSALHVDGDRVTAIADTGSVVSFRMNHASDSKITSLPQECGTQGLKRERDAESLARDTATGRWFVGFEWSNAICRVSFDLTRAEASARPPAMRGWPRRGGAETMLRLADGRFLAIGEHGNGRTNPMVVFGGDPTAPDTISVRGGYRRLEGFDPTDAAQLPDGRILILNRRFSLRSLFEAAITVINPMDLEAGALVEGKLLARITPQLAENYEGLSVTVENGRTIVWLVSDDNFMRWQRTLLLKFALEEAKPRSSSRSNASGGAPSN